MALQNLLVQNLRIIESLELPLAEDANLFYGENGAGKTSILEAIDFLSRGRSFRNRRITPLLRKGAEEITVSGHILIDGQPSQLGIQKSSKETVLHFNHEKVSTIAEHASHLPVLSIHPDSHQLIQGASLQRRNYLDWSVFHVKPGFLQDWRAYNKCLRQRNHVLRQRLTKELPTWTKQLVELGETITLARSEIFEAIIPIFATYIDKLLPESRISLEYLQGWSEDQSLLLALDQAQEQELHSKATRYGPHRADIKIQLNDQDAAASASRGQQKLLAASLLLAQVHHLQAHTTRRCIVLLDDFRAELDHAHAHALMQAIQALGCQVFITAIEPEQVDLQGWNCTQMFHVKHGECKPSA